MITSVDEDQRHTDLPSLEAQIEVEKRSSRTVATPTSRLAPRSSRTTSRRWRPRAPSPTPSARSANSAEREMNQIRKRADAPGRAPAQVWDRFKNLKVQDPRATRSSTARCVTASVCTSGWHGRRRDPEASGVLDLDAEALLLREIIATGKGQKKTRPEAAQGRLRVHDDDQKAGRNGPRRRPGHPPDLRPMVQLDGAASRRRTSTTSTRRVINATTASSGCSTSAPPRSSSQREADAAGGRRQPLRQRSRGRRSRSRQPPAQVAVRHAQGQAGAFPPEPRASASILRPFGHRRRPAAQAAPVRLPSRWLSSCSSRS